ncbi:MAG: RNA 2'-phosphotransferase [Halohasta sp.]
MSEIRHCETHGYFDSQRCPTCGTRGESVVSAARRSRVSKFLSGALRHFPDDVGLELDDGGWTDWSALVDRTSKTYGWLDDGAFDAEETITAIVQTDPKGRFEADGDRVRAAYGHSVAVDLEAGGTPVPEVLYHGTSPDALESIREEGLRPMSRQHVHLSGSVDAAREVGRRHASEPVVLRVDAAAMVDDGREITKRGREVYTTDRVPSRYLEDHDRSDG